MKVVDGNFKDEAPMGLALQEVVSDDFIRSIVAGDFILVVNSESTGFFTVSNYESGPTPIYLLEKAKYGLMYEELEDAENG